MCSSSPPVSVQKEISEFRFFNSVFDLPPEEWNVVIPSHAFYARLEHLKVVEGQMQTQGEMVYCLVYNDNEPIAALYFQQFDFPFVNVFSQFNKADAGWRRRLQYRFLRLFKRQNVALLKSGNVFFTGDHGLYFREGVDDVAQKKILRHLLTERLWNQHLSHQPQAVFLSDLSERQCFDKEDVCSFHQLNTLPDLWMDLQDDWEDFSDYHAALSSKYRVRANKVFERSSAIVLRSVELDEIAANESRMLELYGNVANHASFNMARLQASYFTEMKALYGADMPVTFFETDGAMQAFMTAFAIDETFHVHFIGLDYQVNEQLSLYHRMLFETVRQALEFGCKRIHFGRTATEIKTTIGAVPIEVFAYLRMEKPWINRPISRLLPAFGPEPYVQRHPFRLDK